MYSSVIVAAGLGKRTGLDYNKILYKLKGKPMLLYSVDLFVGDPDCDEIIIVCSQGDFTEFQKLILSSKCKLVFGGASRQESVMNGLSEVFSKYVMIHDGARPNIKQEMIDAIKKDLPDKKAITLGVLVKDTLKIAKQNIITGDIDRDNTYLIQTPQAFLTKDILNAHKLAIKNQHTYLDDSSVYQNELQMPVYIVPGSEENLKGTTLIDLLILEGLL